MPSSSGRQHRFFGFLKSHPDIAKAKGIKASVVNDFLHADRGRHFGPPPPPQLKPRFMFPKRS